MAVCECTLITDEQVLTTYLETKDHDLLTILHKRMYNRLRSLAMRILRSQDDAEDIVQSVFCKLCELKAEPIRSAQSFLFRMVKNLALNHRRDSQTGIQRDMVSLTSIELQERVRFVSDKVLDTELEHEPVDQAKSAEQKFETQEDWENARLVMHCLSPKQQAAITTYYERGLTIAETAEVLGINENTAWTLIRRGIGILRRTLAPNAFCDRE